VSTYSNLTEEVNVDVGDELNNGKQLARSAAPPPLNDEGSHLHLAVALDGVL
jgi:hypothetical protein